MTGAMARGMTLEKSSPRWQYHRLVLDTADLFRGELDRALDRLGRDGWELTTAVPRDMADGDKHQVCLLFKRAVDVMTT